MKERTVFEGLAPNARVSAELISAWERTMADLDDEIASKMRSRAAYLRLIQQGRQRLETQSEK